MTFPKPRASVETRGWTLEMVAARLGVSVTWFQENRQSLESEGFPVADKLLAGRYDGRAVDAWWDRRSGIAANDDTGVDVARERVRRHVQNNA
ncbi:MAG: hypothetical protein JNK21_01795 [Rhodospirillaceae bacterium]|nr:hypothetical protein [Rhodospirillaceae bacterium]